MTDVSRYDYEVPRELIAQAPLPNRSDARMLVVSRRDQSLLHAHVRDLPEYVQPPDCVVLNDTRVLPARLVGYRVATGGRWTGLFLGACETGQWQVLGRTRGRLKAGERIMLVDRAAQDALELTMVAHAGAGVWIAVPARADSSVDLLDQVGRVPLPPYIRGGQMVERDRERYQTVFARHPGAVAAPTAGLHFTNELLGRLIDAGVAICRVTLHVGIGTFRPLQVLQIEDHQMHAEWGEITATNVARIEACRRAGGRVVAIGTTSMRVLETAARQGPLRPWQGQTRLYIRPPFQFHCVDALLTNFHWPHSTLLVLARTFGGDDLVQQAYATAIQQRYRFYSYGDAMFIR